MDRNIPISISDQELVIDKYCVNSVISKRNKSFPLQQTNSLSLGENFNLINNTTDYSNNNNNISNSNNNYYYCDDDDDHHQLQHCRTKSFRPRMVARSSVNYRHKTGNHLLHNQYTGSFSDQHTRSNTFCYQSIQNNINTPYNTRNNSYNPSIEYMSLYSDRPLTTSIPYYSSTITTTVTTTTTNTTTTTTSTTPTPTTITTTLIQNKMESQLLTSSFSPEIINNSPREQHHDEFMLNKKIGINRTIKYLDNTKLIRRESKSYSTTISPIPLISYHQNVIPSSMDLMPMILDKNTTTTDKKLHNDEISSNKKMHKLKNVGKSLNVNKARVELVLIFVKVGQVDTVNERYQADIFLQARWREPLLDAMWNKSSLKSKSSWQTNPSIENPFTDLTSKRQLNTLKLQDDEFWNPRLLIDNAEGEPIEIISHEVEFMEPDFEAYLVEKRRIKGIFHETLELRHFPFDCQDLSVTITCDRTTDEVELVASPTEVSQVDVRCAADSQEWKIFHHVDIKSMEIQTGYSPGTSKRRHPGLVFTSRSARRSGYFLVNMILISCVLCLLSFAAFSVPANENRLQLSLLLLLTTVTFKFAASQNLPKISYLTYLDKVVLVNFFMLVILTVWHAIARGVSASKPKFLEYEHYVMYSLLSCYCLGSVLFGLTVYLDAGSRRRLMQRKDVEFNQYKQHIEAEKQHHSILSVSLEEWLNSPHNSITNDFLDKNDS
ncbi:hypothetical protein MN116_008240 [Schistosoma mekongi]|uniref:Neurotransmitter-gated ion-channel ligand-binding domain-containing protein n=1 Tax=Schistosoma mekongi TaxID=38744 RepID=A0AAE1Z5P9_SCHME|nr:hypothetical protein MN116_008240 [Schistosoma mekongi]